MKHPLIRLDDSSSVEITDSNLNGTAINDMKASCVDGKLVINGDTVAEGVKVWTIQHDGVPADGKKVWPRDPSPRERG